MQVYADLLKEIGIFIDVPPSPPQDPPKVKCCHQLGNHRLDQSGRFYYCCVCECVLSDAVFTTQNPGFSNEDAQWGSQKKNNGRNAATNRKFYSQYTNLKEYLISFVGGNQRQHCDEWNLGVDCRNCTQTWFRKCKFRHRCKSCDGQHCESKCPHPLGWKDQVRSVFQKSDRNAYMTIRTKLKEMKLRTQYKHIYPLIYEFGGEKPRISSAQFEQIKNDLRAVEWYYKRRKTKKSLCSALMVLNHVLVLNDVDSFYLLPELRNRGARERANSFTANFYHDVICQRDRSRTVSPPKSAD